MYTFKYKEGYIHSNFMNQPECFTAQLGQLTKSCKTYRSSQIWITKQINKAPIGTHWEY